MKNTLLLAVVLLSVVGGCQKSPEEKHESVKANIVETAISNGDFKILVAALGAADLVETLKGAGPFTVFAPSDKAFEQLPNGELDLLLEPKNKQKLSSVLTYHVVGGEIAASEVVTLSNAKTVNGKSVSILAKDGIIWVDGAKIVKTDIRCSNGVIHVIDKVLMP